MGRDPAHPSSGAGAAAPPGACVHCPRKVVRIKVKLPTTQPVTKAWRVPPSKNFQEFSSDSHNQALNTNVPTILVRNCGTVQLEAVTDPPDQKDVAWGVLPNPGPDPNPKLGALVGLHSSLTTDASGGYSVSATLDGTTVFWNVVFVDATIRESAMKTGGNLESVSTTEDFAIKTGVFDPTDPTHCGMWVQAKIDVSAGGQPALSEFRKKVHFGFVQNIRELTHGAGAAYEPTPPHGRKKYERLRFSRAGTPSAPWDPTETVLGVNITDIGFPILDAGAAPSGGDTAFLSHASSDPDLWVAFAQTVTGSDADLDARVITTCDSPQVVFDAHLPEFVPGGIEKTRPAIETTGTIKFRTHLAAFSEDASFCYVVFGYADWSLDIGGTINWFATSTGDAQWIKGSAEIKPDPKLTEVNHGKEARHAGCEVCGPVALTVLHRDATN